MAGPDFHDEQMGAVRRLEAMQPQRGEGFERIRDLRLRYKLILGLVLVLGGSGFISWALPSCGEKPGERTPEITEIFEGTTPETEPPAPAESPGSTDKPAQEKTDGGRKEVESLESISGAFTIKEEKDGSFETKITKSPPGLTCYPPEIVKTGFGLVARFTLERIESDERRQTAYHLISLTVNPTSEEIEVPFEISLLELVWQ